MDKDSLYLSATPREKLWVQLMLIFAQEGDVGSMVRAYNELEIDAYNRGWEDALYDKGRK